MVLEITYYGNPILRKKAKPVTVFNKELEYLCHNMIETMHSANGIGIAAPQVGVSLQIFIADPSPEEEDKDKLDPLVIINPSLTFLDKHKTDIAKEGCLSIPGLYAPVKRYDKVLLKAVDQYNKPFEIEVEGLVARIFQHEYDHLQGVLFTDKVLAREKKRVDQKLNEIRNNNA